VVPRRLRDLARNVRNLELTSLASATPRRGATSATLLLTAPTSTQLEERVVVGVTKAGLRNLGTRDGPLNLNPIANVILEKGEIGERNRLGIKIH
jgi:hypothetical protein